MSRIPVVASGGPDEVGKPVPGALPLLSLCIPTYNRLPYLRQCIDSILTATERCREPVEILISDNASTDATAAYLTDLVTRVSSLRVIRQVENIGGERNFRVLVKAASGKCVWVIGDDDLLQPDAVSLVIRRIQEGSTCIICNYSVWDKDLTRVIADRGLKEGRDLQISSKNEVMRLFGLNLGYITSVVMDRTLFLTLTDAEYESFTSYGFPFMYAAYVGFGVECKLAYIAAPIVVNRSGNSDGYDWYRYFVQGSSLIFDRLVERFGYGRASVSIARTQVIHQYVVRHFAARRLSHGDITGLPSLLFKNYWFLPSFWLALVPVILMPRSLIASARDLAKRLR